MDPLETNPFRPSRKSSIIPVSVMQNARIGIRAIANASSHVTGSVRVDKKTWAKSLRENPKKKPKMSEPKIKTRP